MARVVSDVKARTLEMFVREAISTRVGLVVTDQWIGYKHRGREFPQGTVDHAAGEYVVGTFHTNTIEGFWKIFKRGIVGTFHKASAKYLPLNVVEFQFRYNNRNNEDVFSAAVAGYGSVWTGRRFRKRQKALAGQCS